MAGVGAPIAAEFLARTGELADGVWSAPGRATLIGEHLDYNGGTVLPFAIDRRTHLAVRMTNTGRLRCWSLQVGRPSDTAIDDAASAVGWARYVAGTLAAVGAAGAAVRPLSGLDVVIDSDVPVGAGISSSAALTCAVGLAVDQLTGAGLSQMDLARACRRAEADFAGAPVGLMDPVASLFGQPSHVLAFDTAAGSVRPMPLPLEATGTSLLLVDTGTRHEIGGGEYAARRRSCEAAASRLDVRSLATADPAALHALDAEPLLLRRARHVVTEQGRVVEALDALADRDMATLGRLMTGSHESLRDDFEVSTPDLDQTVDAALQAGALGARLTGGGFGGCVLVLCARDRLAAVRLAVVERAARRRAADPVTWEVAPAEGARRVA